MEFEWGRRSPPADQLYLVPLFNWHCLATLYFVLVLFVATEVQMYSLLCFGTIRTDINIDGTGGIVLTYCYCVYLFRHSRMSRSGIDGSGGIGE